MKKFLFFVGIYSSIVLGVIFWIFLNFNGSHDDFYLRFTTTKQESLILGTSIAAQGMVPSEINPYLSNPDLYNYAFSIFHSPYGPSYFHSISKKLNQDTKNGIFILAVDPWSLGVTIDSTSKKEVYQELEHAVHGIHWVSARPNFEYLLQYASGTSLLEMLLTKNKSTFLHDDGWLEVNIPMDSISYGKRLTFKRKDYAERERSFKKSPNRVDWLNKTISLLKKHGTVYLVRLPIGKEFLQMEERIWPQFSDFFERLGKINKVCTFDFSSKYMDYRYTDEYHLHQSSSRKISSEIGKMIQIDQQKRNKTP